MFDKTKKKLISGVRKILMGKSQYFNDTVFENCGHVMLYPQVKCAYNRVKKAANSSTLMFMGDAMAASGFSHPLGLDENNYHRSKHESVKYGISLSKVWSPYLLKQMSDYFWFTVVRNPYTRLLSAYLQKGAGGQRGSPYYQHIPGFDRLDPAGFKDFVFFLKHGGLHENMHWWPQSDLLFMPAERFDYIAKTESLESDLKHVFQQVGLHNTQHLSFSKPHIAENSAGWKVTNANSHAVEFYDDEIRDIVYDLYKSDFKKFGYDYDKFR